MMRRRCGTIGYFIVVQLQEDDGDANASLHRLVISSTPLPQTIIVPPLSLEIPSHTNKSKIQAERTKDDGHMVFTKTDTWKTKSLHVEDQTSTCQDVEGAGGVSEGSPPTHQHHSFQQTEEPHWPSASRPWSPPPT